MVGSGGYSEGGCSVSYVYLPGDLSDIFGSPIFDGARIEVYTDGCTDSLAINYNSDAEVDDGSCITAIPGCTDENADNYNPQANTNDGSCSIAGCMNEMAINYDPDANVDDGSCLLIGCSDSTYLEYYNQGFIPSINDTQNNEVFCQNVAIFGCMDQAACNYSPNVNVDDYSCLYSNDGFDCDNNFVSMSCHPFHEYNGYHDNFFGVHPSFSFENNETIINISQGEINYTFQVVGSGGYSEGGCNVSYVYLPGDLSDIFGSPIFDGARIEVYTDGCTDSLAINYNSDAEVDDGSCITAIPGCTDENADNYNPQANTNDGSCSIAGCMNEMAINYDPDANVDDGSCLLIGCSDSTYLEYYNQGFIPSINDTQNNEVFCQNVAIFGCMDQAACNYSPNVNVDDYSCLYSNDGFDCDNNFVSMSCHPFHEYNGYHDNFFGVHPSFSFENNETIINISQGEINYTFQVVGSGGYSEGGCNVSYVYLPGDLSDIFGSPFFDGARIEVYTDGCTDPAAINYNENADIDFHGSCLFSGCMSEWADNYDSFAYEDDGSCYREGCTSDWADNYDSLATINNNSCRIQLNEQEYEAVLTNNSLISSLQEQIDNLSYIESQYNVVLNAYSIIEEQLEQCQPDAYGQISLELKEGWNMIGYNLIFPSNMVEQLSEIESDINVIKDNNGNFYWPSFGFNGIGNFTPGHGYLIKMYNDRDFIFEP